MVTQWQPQEEGTTPNKSIPGYEFTGKTITDENGNTTQHLP
nr:hypothetical protein [Streptococcus hyointestinalis]